MKKFLALLLVAVLVHRAGGSKATAADTTLSRMQSATDATPATEP
ncbi:MAG: hypothetical protein R2912_09350 [Eubacteriales bacterium]